MRKLIFMVDCLQIAPALQIFLSYFLYIVAVSQPYSRITHHLHFTLLKSPLLVILTSFLEKGTLQPYLNLITQHPTFTHVTFTANTKINLNKRDCGQLAVSYAVSTSQHRKYVNGLITSPFTLMRTLNMVVCLHLGIEKVTYR